MSYSNYDFEDFNNFDEFEPFEQDAPPIEDEENDDNDDSEDETSSQSRRTLPTWKYFNEQTTQHPGYPDQKTQNDNSKTQFETATYLVQQDIFNKKSQIEAWDVLCISRSQKAGEYVNEVNSRIMKQAEMVREEEAGTSSGHKYTEGATIPAKKLASEDPKKENSKKQPAKEAPSIITPAPSLCGRSSPPSYKSGDNSFDAEASTPSPSNGHDVSDTGIHEDEDENPFITKYEEGSRNNNKFLNDKQLLDIKWHENWVKWSTLSTDEDKSIFDCAQEVTKNFISTYAHIFCHRNKGQMESLKVRKKDEY
ncbi:hypothetical protein C1646_669958 [Rhizophagus diaphanus]|nr:hypothetical protein C1646_669958 [Rhizophagus diaphanus] [Rhizophagus sp. MUCL 43196]